MASLIAALAILALLIDPSAICAVLIAALAILAVPIVPF
ncbi:Protein of unknown function [Leuconostoc citreum LBAE C10]|nr:Protein of unknown function [Leuconostoc citreum LBAE C10]